MIRTTTNGSGKDAPVGSAYFLALQGVDLRAASHHFLKDKWVLVALNYLVNGNKVSNDRVQELKALAERGHSFYLDSGCFTLANAHANKTGQNPWDVFMTSPSKLPFFNAWFDLYCMVVPVLKPYLWGVVEIDFGSAEERAETRERIYKACGIKPIPVYRCLSEPFEVFEKLVATHDRVCLAGTAKVPTWARYAAYSKATEIIERANPKCRVHALGVGAFGPFTASLLNSCDSSTYANPARFGLTCGYTLTGFSHAAHWAKKVRLASKGGKMTIGTAAEGGSVSDLIRSIGMFQHSGFNVGRTAHLKDIAKYRK
jgi:hypothetical protein